MNQRMRSTFGYSGTVLAAAIAATCMMTSRVHAETPSVDILQFTGTRSRAEVRDEVLHDRHLVSTASNEVGAYDAPRRMSTGLTRAAARAGYLGSKDEVRAMTAEDSGSSWLSRPHRSVTRAPMVVGASSQ